MTLHHHERWAKIILVASLGIFGLLIGLDNLLYPNINASFVNEVLLLKHMPAFFDSHMVIARQVITPFWHHFFYGLIIIGELLFGSLSLWGAVKMIQTRATDAFQGAKVFFLWGAVIGLLIWYLGFSVIASEYFSMWANHGPTQATAYLFSIFLLVSLQYVWRREEC